MSDIVSRPYSKQGREHYDRIFRKPGIPETDCGNNKQPVSIQATEVVGMHFVNYEQSIADLEARVAEFQDPEEVIEMGLCEVPYIGLRPGQLYRFVVMPGCEKCAAAAAPYANET